MKRKFLRFNLRILLAGLIIIVLIILTGCTRLSAKITQTTAAPSTATTQPLQTIVPSATATMDTNNSLIFHIQGVVAAPGMVAVEYWGPEVGPFVTAPVATSGTSFSLEVMRLRPTTQYNFQVFLETSTNAPVSQYQGTFTTGPLPLGLQNAVIKNVQGTPTYDLLMLDYDCDNFFGIVAIDGNANIVWYYQNDDEVFTQAQEDNYNIVFNELALSVGYTMKEIAPGGSLVASVEDTLPDGTISSPAGRWNHEMLVRPDNKVWTIGAEIRTVNINGKDTLQTGGTIEEWDTVKGTVTRLVSMFDLLNPVTDRGVDSDLTSGFYWTGSHNQYAGVTEDWTHTNSLDVMPDGNVLVSNRHLDQLIAVKPDFSGIVWRLGGIGSNFTFPDPNDRFYHQHYVRMLPDGHILLFDNGNLRPQSQGGEYSRAEELALDFNTMQARKVWEYRNSPDWFSSAVGSSIRLANGDTVVDFGVDDVTENPSVFQVVEATPDGKALSITTISSPGKGDQYRAIPLDSLNGETREPLQVGQ